MVTEFDSVNPLSGSRWKVLCDCGNVSIVYAKTLREKTSTSCGCSFKLKPGDSSRNNIYRQYKRDSPKRGLVFELTIDQFTKITSSNCYYCGIEPRQTNKNQERYMAPYLYNGIDRVDNDVGYVFENCVAACVDCNYMKRKRTLEEFVEKCKVIAKRF